MNRRGFLKSLAVAVVAPTILKDVAFPAAATVRGVSAEQCAELIAMTLQDMPKEPVLQVGCEWVNYYASYDYDITELYCGKESKEREKVNKAFRRAFEDSGIVGRPEVERDHLFVGQQGMSDGGWPTSIPRDGH